MEDAAALRRRRAQQWSEYLVRIIQEWKLARPEETFTSKRDLALRIGVEPMSLTQWWAGNKYPSMDSALLVARFFGKDQMEVLRAAGYYIEE